jgi:tryprostatin B 6-hydroxylase
VAFGKRCENVQTAASPSSEIHIRMPLLSTALAAALVGASTHLCFFIRGEHHLYGTRYLQIFVTAITIALFLDVRVAKQSFVSALGDVSSLAACFITGLYSSLLGYRAFLHPLRKFPGPFGNRLGNLWFSAQLSKGDAYKQVFALHQKYGDFVRVGSSDLSIIHPKAVNVIYGPGTKCDRAAFYNGDPLPSLISTRERGAHDRRRRVWSPAFSDKALRGYAERTKIYDDQLLSRIEAASASGASMNLSKWFNYYSFDVMGDLAFGESFDMLKNDQEHWAVGLMNEGLEALVFLFPVWLFRVLVAIPGLLRDHERIVKFCNERLEKRIKVMWPKESASVLLIDHRTRQKSILQM